MDIKRKNDEEIKVERIVNVKYNELPTYEA